MADNLIGYVATGVVSLAVGLAIRYLGPRAKLAYWTPEQSFLFLQNEKRSIHVHTLVVQNVGRRPAEDVQIVYQAKPDYLALSPALIHQVGQSPTGEHIISLPNLGPKETVSIQSLTYNPVATLSTVRSKEGSAEWRLFTPQRVYSAKVNIAAAVLLLLGLGTAVYWVVKAATFLVGLIRK